MPITAQTVLDALGHSVRDRDTLKDASVVVLIGGRIVPVARVEVWTGHAIIHHALDNRDNEQRIVLIPQGNSIDD